MRPCVAEHGVAPVAAARAQRAAVKWAGQPAPPGAVGVHPLSFLALFTQFGLQ